MGTFAAYLNCRLILGILFCATLLAGSIKRALQEGRPEIPRVAEFSKLAPISAPKGLLSSVVYPFLVVFDVLLAVIWIFSNVLWLTTATTAVYLYRTGVNLADYVHHLILHRRLRTGILRLAALYGLIYFFCYGINAATPAIQRYLSTSVSVGGSYSEMFTDLEAIGIFCLFLSLGVTSHFLIVHVGERIFPDGQRLRESLYRQAFASAITVVGYLCAAGLIYLIVNLHLVTVSGFQGIGPLTLVITILVLAISTVFIVIRIVERPEKLSLKPLGSTLNRTGLSLSTKRMTSTPGTERKAPTSSNQK